TEFFKKKLNGTTNLNHPHLNKNDKELDEDVLILFKRKIKLLLDDVDDKLLESDKRGIKRLINNVIENQTYSKQAKLIFKQLLEKKCREYNYESVQLYCRVCKRYDDFDKRDNYISCGHLRRPIDIIEAFEFAQYSKEFCKDRQYHYEIVSPLFDNKD
ncbi:34027_t:CDS:1, partial [Racocetra persica]